MEERIENEVIELQTTFNEDGMEELCSEDTVVENAEEVEQ